MKITKSNPAPSWLQPRLLAGCVALVISTASLSAQAAAEVDRVKRDINMMTKIVNTAVEESADCKGCSVDIKGHYLQGQGAVFYIDPKRGYRFVSAPDSVFEIVQSVSEVPGIVHEVLEDLEMDYDNENFTYSFGSDGAFAPRSEHDQISKTKIRTIERELRSVERELRKAEIEMLHDLDAEREELDKQRLALESQREQAEEKRELLEKERKGYIVKIKQTREEQKQKKLEAQQERMVQIETTILNTFCDYGNTIRNLSRGEHVSLIINSVTSNEDSRIFILDQSDLNDCDSRKNDFRSKAVSYTY